MTIYVLIMKEIRNSKNLRKIPWLSNMYCLKWKKTKMWKPCFQDSKLQCLYLSSEKMAYHY